MSLTKHKNDTVKNKTVRSICYLRTHASVVQQIHTDNIKENVSLTKQREQKTREGNTVFFTIIHNEFISASGTF